MRMPSTPRSIQNRTVSNIAALTAGFRQLRSGWDGRNEWRYHWPVGSSHVHAGPPNTESQLLGGEPSGCGSAHVYQSRRGSSRDERAAVNHGCWSDVWFGTQSTITRSPRRWAAASSASKSASVPNSGSTPQ